MLVLSRRPGEYFTVEVPQGQFTVKVNKIRGNLVYIAIDAPFKFKILRSELQ